MAQHRVAMMDGGIYAGTLAKRRDGLMVWRVRTLVSDQALRAAAEYLARRGIRYDFELDGRRLRLAVTEVGSNG